MLNRCSITLLVGCVALAACGRGQPGPAASSAPAAAAAQVHVLAETPGSAQDNGNDVAFWIHPSDPRRSLVLVSAGTAGLEAFALDGTRAAHFTGGEFDYVDVSYGDGAGADGGATVVAYDRKQRGLWALSIDPQTLAISAISKSAFQTGGEVTGLCTYRSAVTGDQYAFAATHGLIEQWKFYVADGEVRGTLVRTIPIGIGAGYCATDSTSGSLYVAEETVGIWKVAAEPETEAERSAVDLVAPFGTLKEEVKGIAVYRVDAATAYLIATDAGDESYSVYDLAGHKLLGRFKATAAAGNAELDAVGESEGIAATAYDFGGAYPSGLLAIFDESNEGEHGNAKLVRWSAIAEALKISAAKGFEPRAVAAPRAVVVAPDVETRP